MFQHPPLLQQLLIEKTFLQNQIKSQNESQRAMKTYMDALFIKANWYQQEFTEAQSTAIQYKRSPNVSHINAAIQQTLEKRMKHLSNQTKSLIDQHMHNAQIYKNCLQRSQQFQKKLIHCNASIQRNLSSFTLIDKFSHIFGQIIYKFCDDNLIIQFPSTNRKANISLREREGASLNIPIIPYFYSMPEGKQQLQLARRSYQLTGSESMELYCQINLSRQNNQLQIQPVKFVPAIINKPTSNNLLNYRMGK